MNRRRAIKWILLSVCGVPTIFYVAHGRSNKKNLIIPKDELKNIPLIKNGVMITKKGNEKIDVIRLKCTHLGCKLTFDKEHNLFICPCHGSIFDSDGKNIKGPAKYPLIHPNIRFNSKGDLVVELDT